MAIYYVLAGFSVGMLVGLTGIGGGAIMTPLLVLGFNVPPLTAVSTDLLFASVTKISGIINYLKHDLVKWPIVLRLLAGSIPSTLATLWALQTWPALAELDHILIGLLGFTLILTAVAMFFRQHFITWRESKLQANQISILDTHTGSLTIFTGLIIGVLVTLTSVGAGALGTVALIILYPKLPLKNIIASELMHAIVLAITASSGHTNMGHIDWTLLSYLVIGSIPGSFCGSRLGINIDPKWVRYILSVILFIIGAFLLQRFIGD